MIVDAWLPRAAAARPDHPAINAMTYAELEERARRAAGALRPGERVGLAGLAAEDFAVMLHACLLRGAVAVPHAEHKGAWHRNIKVPGTAGAEGGSGGADGGASGAEGAERDARGAERRAGGADGGARGAAFSGPVGHDLDATAIVVRTSGTTGAPREVELTYGNWLWSALGSAVALGHPPSERWLCALPLTHVGGLSILLRSVIAGTTVLLHERWSTDAVLLGLDDATMVSLVPTTLKRLLDAGLREPPALRWALLGGAPIPPALLDRAHDAGVPVASTYGLTEACSQVTTHGRPLFCTKVALAGDGEILVSGPTVAGGGVLHTGDLGRFDEDGRLYVVGRKADTIITGGENVAPAEVEAVLEQHPAVAEAAVHGRPDEEWGEAVVATVVLAGEATAENLRAHVAARLEPFKVPKEIAVREEPLPRTASGKLLRRALSA
ncbi:MAG TPA: AMP-binding protein [Solirubrobacteraceae bacterium]|nr:AMP-binding protein [Solirubrobacteraceae bacterium]